MKLFGHPLHVMLVDFPAALLPMELLAYAAFWYYSDVVFSNTSFHLMVAGVLLGWLAAAFGLWDLVNVANRHQGAVKTTLWHGGLNAATLTVYTVILYSASKTFPEPQHLSAGLLFARIFANAVMLVGNFYGGELIFKHKIAVRS